MSEENGKPKRESDPAWLLTKKLGIGLAEARARLAAELAEESAEESPPTLDDTTGEATDQ